MTAVHYAFQPSIPAGTPASAPVTIDMPFPDCELTSIVIQIPPGPRGNLGIRLTTAGLTVIPTTPGTWLITDNFTFTFTPDADTPVSDWQITGYNTGQYAHAPIITFYGDTLGSSTVAAPVALLNNSDLGPADTDTMDATS